ncbi:MAG TPA: efflux RND transporter periplasmic adaptor subunit [Brevundimonas sp.]|uniref:efflux RND transporter periplasmic adaptor subunit n=1 Tax=Brevundimonas sp. TaxID=1871086 RepID=UPI002C34DCE7|nr:efflux RND transporter periplasmic adaptor subunit [Brevundimonas sp.]HRH20114.1 efflux RND transporter periplasmic adaptor subunit [Brevundimonas sp.]
MYDDTSLTRARRGPNRRLLILIAVGVIAALIAGGLFLFSRGHEEPQAAAAASRGGSRQPVTVAVATTRSLTRTVTASGTVTAWEEVPVGAETGGLTATAVLTDEGRYVQQGQVLVQLNDTLLRAQLRQQNAAVASAQAGLDQANNALARAQELRDRGFLSQAGLDTAVAQQATAQAQLNAATAGHAETQARVSQASIRAPVSGLVISRSVTRGQIVQPGTELFRIVRDGRLELDAQIPETEIRLVRAGQSAVVSSDDIGSASGSVRIVTPEVDAQTRLGVARISLASGSGLRAGMFARAEIDVGAQEAVVVPTASILYRENRSGVFVLVEGGVARFQEVSVRSRTDAFSAVDGIPAGAQVIVEGAGFLGDGDRVAVTPAQ